LNPVNWQNFAGGAYEEGLLPAGFALALLISTWVLYDARRRHLRAPAATAWTLLALLFPPVVLPIYLIARSFTHQPDRPAAAATEAADATETQGDPRDTSPAEMAHTDDAVGGRAADLRPKWRFALPLSYLLLLSALGALYFYLDYQSTDAHLARANRARLNNQPERVVREYRAALAQEDDPHTHKLLGIELSLAGRTEEALAEFLAAERGGEPDERLHFLIATALDTLGRTTEAAPAYQKFLQSRLCVQWNGAPDCALSRARLRTLESSPTPE
jgi:tetratricopeptide (TPR) repeat protein